MTDTRLPAAARMDRIYRHQRFVYDLTRKYYLLGRDLLLAELLPGSGSALEIGCGTGRNLIVAARRYGDARFYGVDISCEMLDTAKAHLRQAGLEARVRVVIADATAAELPPGLGPHRYDRIFMSYTLSMIPEWRTALDRAAALLAPGGRLLIVDFGQQEGLPGWFKRLLFGWLALFHVHPSPDLAAALEQIARRHDLVLRQRSLFRGYAVYATLVRSWSPRIAA